MGERRAGRRQPGNRAETWPFSCGPGRMGREGEVIPREPGTEARLPVLTDPCREAPPGVADPVTTWSGRICASIPERTLLVSRNFQHPAESGCSLTRAAHS